MPTHISVSTIELNSIKFKSGKRSEITMLLLFIHLSRLAFDSTQPTYCVRDNHLWFNHYVRCFIPNNRVRLGLNNCTTTVSMNWMAVQIFGIYLDLLWLSMCQKRFCSVFLCGWRASDDTHISFGISMLDWKKQTSNKIQILDLDGWSRIRLDEKRSK